MRRFLTSRWVVAHVFLVGVVGVCLVLGFWQLRRLDERRALNTRIEQRQARAAVPLGAPGDADPAGLTYRRVEVWGIYDLDREVLVAGRSLDGRPGHHVLTPLLHEEGWGVVVERGWVPYELDRPPVAPAAPTSVAARIEGVALASQDAGADPPSDVLRRPDVSLVAARVPYPLHPFYVRLQRQDPAQDELPVIVAPPAPTEGPHLAYAVQWFLLGATAIGVYAALVRRDLRRRRRAGYPPEMTVSPGGPGVRSNDGT